MEMKYMVSILITLALLVGVTSYVHSEKVSELTIVAFGDSNTQGANWLENQYDNKNKWTNLLKSNVQKVINSGVGGDTTNQGMERFEQDVLKYKPDKVLVMFGTNDAVMLKPNQPQVSKELFKKNMQYFIDNIKAAGAEPILMTTLPIIEGSKDKFYYSRHDQSLYPNGSREWHNSYNDIVRELAKENKVDLIDNWKVFIDNSGNTDRDLIESDYIDPSGTHLSENGSKLIYKNILSNLREFF